MKFFLVLCAVASMAAFANAGLLGTLLDMSDLKVDTSKLAINKSGGPPLSEEQIQCIKDGLQPIKDSHQDLAEWFAKGEASVEKFKGRFEEECDVLEGRKRRECLAKLKAAGFAEAAKFISKLKSGQKKVIKEIRTVVLACLKKPETQ